MLCLPPPSLEAGDAPGTTNNALKLNQYSKKDATMIGIDWFAEIREKIFLYLYLLIVEQDKQGRIFEFERLIGFFFLNFNTGH